MKNFIIGGNFTTNPWQRGNTFNSAVGGSFTADQWLVMGDNNAVTNVSNTADSPSLAQCGMLSNNCMQLDIATPTSTLTSAQSSYMKTIIEGYTFSQFAQQEVTLSFWVKSTTPGIYCCAVSNGVLNDVPPPPVFPYYQTCVFEYTINQANTWEKQVITIPPSPSTGVWQYGIGRGYQIYFLNALGSGFCTSVTGSWQLHPGAGVYLGTPNQTNNITTTSSFSLALVQLELGNTATSYESRHFADEMLLCQRYYHKTFPQSVVPAFGAGLTGAVKYRSFGTSVLAGQSIDFPVRMRIVPDVVYYNPSMPNANWRNNSVLKDSGKAVTGDISDRTCYICNTQLPTDSISNMMYVHATFDASL